MHAGFSSFFMSAVSYMKINLKNKDGTKLLKKMTNVYDDLKSISALELSNFNSNNVIAFI